MTNMVVNTLKTAANITTAAVQKTKSAANVAATSAAALAPAVGNKTTALIDKTIKLSTAVKDAKYVSGQNEMVQKGAQRVGKEFLKQAVKDPEGQNKQELKNNSTTRAMEHVDSAKSSVTAHKAVKTIFKNREVIMEGAKTLKNATNIKNIKNMITILSGVKKAAEGGAAVSTMGVSAILSGINSGAGIAAGAYFTYGNTTSGDVLDHVVDSQLLKLADKIKDSESFKQTINAEMKTVLTNPKFRQQNGSLDLAQIGKHYASSSEGKQMGLVIGMIINPSSNLVASLIFNKAEKMEAAVSLYQEAKATGDSEKMTSALKYIHKYQNEIGDNPGAKQLLAASEPNGTLKPRVDAGVGMLL